MAKAWEQHGWQGGSFELNLGSGNFRKERDKILTLSSVPVRGEGDWLIVYLLR